MNEHFEVKLELKERLSKYDKYILSKKSYITDDILSVYIIEHELIPYHCKICSHPPLWNKKALTLVLDRLNNTITDNRLENLRFLCPNCFSQINKRKQLFNRIVKEKQRLCIDCNKRIVNKNIRVNNIKCRSQRCKSCLEKHVSKSLI